MGNIYPQILMFHDLPIPMDPVVPLVGFTVSRGCELQPIIHCQGAGRLHGIHRGQADLGRGKPRLRYGKHLFSWIVHGF